MVKRTELVKTEIFPIFGEKLLMKLMIRQDVGSRYSSVFSSSEGGEGCDACLVRMPGYSPSS